MIFDRKEIIILYLYILKIKKKNKYCKNIIKNY